MGAQVLVVVGAGGMGEAVARRLGAGRTILLADVSEQTLTRAEESLTGEGLTVLPHVVDVSAAESVRELAAAAAAAGEVTALVHTAGLSPVQASTEAILAVDLLGVALVLDAFVEVIAPGGAAVVIASMAGQMAGLTGEQETALAATPTGELLDLPFLAPDKLQPAVAYPLAKRANQLRVRALSVPWGRRGIRINSVSPGVIVTPMGQAELTGESSAYLRAMVRASGTARFGTASDIAAATAFLLGPEASFVTGSDLLVDGGQLAAVTTDQVDYGTGST
ncbi:SDR family oxidoreductase [Frankia sp. AgKG'84/4]|uniref:SDR family oxidoreductase n=1 Tax=Frankia sp. AgKG'84/4 TaxID=573490 RepID=UPI00200DD1F8|nr:SDR family oxidoreductase [Frankia sp. AgKG'84/4]MCL9793345.1 SDR family oxidoreductase [Frankia sp. AgKG'84/4]